MLGEKRPRLKRQGECERPVAVRFARSGITATWTEGSLFLLARDAGIFAPHGCRSGGCGICVTRILHGVVRHGLPGIEPPAGFALICIARPAADSEEELVLDL